MKTYYTVYKTTNKITGRFYIGCHKTSNLNDGYMGSGTYFKRAVEKYGIENFEKEILAIFDNPEDMFMLEYVLVNPEDAGNYNIKEGGMGGWSHLNDSSEEHRARCRLGYQASLANLSPEKIAIRQAKTNKALRQWQKDNPDIVRKMAINNLNKWDGVHTEETKRIIGEKNSIHQKGSGNSQYGTMWITDGRNSKKIKKDTPVPAGWKKGRVI